MLGAARFLDSAASAPVPVTLWNVAAKSVRATVSSDGRTAGRNPSGGDYATVRSTTSRAAGKLHVEYTVAAYGSSGFNPGLCSTSFPVTSGPNNIGHPHAMWVSFSRAGGANVSGGVAGAWWEHEEEFDDGEGGSYFDNVRDFLGFSPGSPVTYAMEIDLDASPRTVSFYFPATASWITKNLGGSLLAGALYLLNGGDNDGTVKLNTGQDPFIIPPRSGYSLWG